MEAIGDWYVTNDNILDAWHCPLDADFADAEGTSRHCAVFAIDVFVKHQDV
jgi:hypothetical protein